MSFSAALAALCESLKIILKAALPTPDEEAKSDRAKAEKNFLNWLKKTETSSEKQEKERSIDS